MSGAARKAWIVAATIGAVEALKDQGICRWNYTLRSLHQHAQNNIRSIAQAKMISSSPSSSAAVSSRLREEKRRKAEEKMRKVMDLSCWGPNTRSSLIPMLNSKVSTFKRIEYRKGEAWKLPLPLDDDTDVEISQFGQVSMSDQSSSITGYNDEDDGSTTDEGESPDGWEEKRKFGAADTFKFPDEFDISHLS